MSRSLQEEDLQPQFVESTTNYISSANRVVQWAIPSCNWPQCLLCRKWRQRREIQLTGRIHDESFTGSTSWATLEQYKSVQPLPGIEPTTFIIRGNHLAYAVTKDIDEEKIIDDEIIFWLKIIFNLGNIHDLNDLNTAVRRLEFEVSGCRTSKFARCFLPAETRVWNDLPYTMFEIGTLDGFQGAANRWLLPSVCLSVFRGAGACPVVKII